MTTNIADLLTRLVAARDAEPDPNTLPISHNQRIERLEHIHQLEHVATGLRHAVDLLVKPSVRLAHAEHRLSLARAALADYAQERLACPDLATLTGAAARDAERRQYDLDAAIRALNAGVEFYGGVPNVPPAPSHNSAASGTDRSSSSAHTVADEQKHVTSCKRHCKATSTSPNRCCVRQRRLKHSRATLTM